jgi:Uma2 family endonuclease
MAIGKAAVPPSQRRPIPIAPTVEAWRAMSAAERERYLLEVLDALSDPWAAMSEGRPHKKAKTRTLDMLGLHFGATGRVVYLAEEMAVVYPGEEPFTPDVLAVVDVPEPEEDERLAWVVADEGKGLDLVLEVLHRGDRKKDLVANVERYARLGIPEYFVYDRAQQRIHGYRLPSPGAKRYQPILPQGGRYGSAVLGIDLAVEGGRLRFFHGMAELFGSSDLIRRLTRMVQERDANAEDAEARAGEAVAALRAGILAALETRGIPVAAELRARVDACDEPATLQRWLLRALVATAAEPIFVEEAPKG